MTFISPARLVPGARLRQTGDAAPSLAAPAQVILIDSDLASGRSLLAALAGHRVTHYAAVTSALPTLRTAQPQLLVLGSSPGPDGRLMACSDARAATRAPILLCAADRRELVLGFRLGADDVVQPPLDCEIVRARAEALIRRGPSDHAIPREAGTAPAAMLAQVGPISLDLLRLRATVGHAIVPLTPPELRVLTVLAERCGEAVSREELSRLALGQEHIAGSRSLDMHVRRLRAKLHAAAARSGAAVTVHAVRGTGYRLDSPDTLAQPAPPVPEAGPLGAFRRGAAEPNAA